MAYFNGTVYKYVVGNYVAQRDRGPFLSHFLAIPLLGTLPTIQ
jgi:hypothetical protein